MCCSCTAKSGDLDNSLDRLLRTRAHTEHLVENHELGDLWYSYGIVGDVVVSTKP